MLDASTLDTAVGHVIIRDQLYRQDNDLNIEETKRAVVFNTFPWELDIEVVPDVLNHRAYKSRMCDKKLSETDRTWLIGEKFINYNT